MENAEKMENMEMFSGSPLRCAPVLGEPCSGSRRTVLRSRRTVLQFSENRAPVSRIITKEVEGSGVCTIVPYWRDTLVSTRWLKSDWKASEGEKQAYICWCFNKDIHCMFVEGSQEQSFFLQTLLFTPFVATVQKIITYALVSTWSWVSSGWEHVSRFMHPWHCQCTEINNM